MRDPVVRVVDASLHPLAGPVHVVVDRLEQASAVRDAVAHAGARGETTTHGLDVVARASQLVDAAGRTGGAALAEPLRAVLDDALAAWAGAVPEVTTPVGVLPTDQRPVVMGILNVTPDSFSDGGEHADPAAAIAHGEALAAAGADVIDVGGESTRPGAAPVDVDTEIARTVPVVEALAAAGHVVSIDTTKAPVAERAVAAGAAMVNDVSAGALDHDMLPTVASLAVPYVLMHMQGTPRTMQRDPTYEDVVADVFAFLAEGLERCEDAGILRDAIVVDPGIGFGKTTSHNLGLLAGLRQLTSLGRPVLVGASRKSFLGRITGIEEAVDRTVPSCAAAAVAVSSGASIVRVHDVAETVLAVRTAAAIVRGAALQEQ